MPLHGLAAQLTTYGYWGEPSPAGDTLNFSSVAGWQQAAASGRIANLELLDGSDARLGAARRKSAHQAEERAPILIASRPIYPASWNVKSAWRRPLGGNETDWDELPAPFRATLEGAAPGLAHLITTPNTPSLYVSQSGGATVPSGAGWLVRFYIYASGSQKRSQLSFIWDRYQIQIADGRATAHSFSAGWTATKEAQLYALLQDDEADQSAIDDLSAEIYQDAQTLDLGHGSEGWYGAPVTLEVLPGAGDCYYVIAGGKSTRVAVALEDGAPLWQAGPLTIRGEGGAYFWQVGYREFATQGALALDHYVSSLDVVIGDAVPIINGTKPAGTNIAIGTASSGSGDDRSYRSTLSLTTSDPRYSPLFSALRIDFPAGARDGGRVGGTATFDSDDTDDPTGHPIKDVQPCFEDAMRRVQYTVDLRDIGGTTFKNVGGERTIEQQVAKLVIGGQTVMTNGIVKDAQPYNMRGATGNQPRTLVANANSGVRVSIVDPWFVLDEMVMRQDYVGDHQRLGFYLRTILKGAGFTDGELTGVGASAGRVLPGAKSSEDWLVRPDARCNFGDYLRDLVCKWGAGWLLYWSSAGVWTFAAPSTTPVASFSRTRGEGGTHLTYAGLDLPREIDEFFNDFVVEGSDRDGNPIVESFQVPGSIAMTGGPLPSKRFIGRRRTKVYSDDAIKTRADALWVARSLKANFGMPPVFAHFESDWISNVFPGQYATHDGVLCRIKSITSGSARRARMSFLLQQAA